MPRRPGPPVAGTGRSAESSREHTASRSEAARRARAAGRAVDAARIASRGSVAGLRPFGEKPVEPAAMDEDLQTEHRRRTAAVAVIVWSERRAWTWRRRYGGQRTPLSSWRPTELRRCRGYPRSCLQPRIVGPASMAPTPILDWLELQMASRPMRGTAVLAARRLWAFRGSRADGRTCGGVAGRAVAHRRGRRPSRFPRTARCCR